MAAFREAPRGKRRGGSAEGLTADWRAPLFAEIVTPIAARAIGAAATASPFAEGGAAPGANRTAILAFRVEDADAEFARLMAGRRSRPRPRTCPGATAL